ncbi:MAG: hypothetical protein K0B05_04990 [Bacteroidales bacterium]|nr:hypothetical protein [Bacteroidales bacterium]
MKKTSLLIIIGLALMLTAVPVSAQGTGGEKVYKYTIKTNPLAALGGPFWVVVIPVTGEYKVLFEAAVAEKSSVQLGVSYIGPSILLNLDELTSEEGEISGLKTSGFRGQGMFRYFVSRDLPAPEGFYLGPHVSYATATIKSKDNAEDNIKASKVNLNAVVGYQLITSGGFTLDIFTGMGFVSRKWDISGSDFDSDTFKNRASVTIPFGFSFGYAF